MPSVSIVRNNATTASALRTVSAEIRRRAALTPSSPFTTLNIRSATTATVVVFMPPPVEAGDAPIIISRLLNSLEPSVKDERSTELNPAVRMVTDWKKALRTSSLPCSTSA